MSRIQSKITARRVASSKSIKITLNFFNINMDENVLRFKSVDSKEFSNDIIIKFYLTNVNGRVVSSGGSNSPSYDVTLTPHKTFGEKSSIVVYWYNDNDEEGSLSLAIQPRQVGNGGVIGYKDII